MKRILLFVAVVALVAGCQRMPDREFFGEAFKPSNPMSVNEVVSKVEGQESMEAVVKGEVEAVCQVKGCWMVLKTEDGEGMRVTFKDYGFFMPTDLGGEIIMKGVASETVTSVDELRHYAEDAKKPQEEIDAITEPLREVTFEATGVTRVN